MGIELLYLLVGAGLTMTVQALIQLRVVPRVEARKRREDRWERDLLALGELLTAELPDRATAAKSDQWILQAIVRDDDYVSFDPKRRDELIRQRSERAQRSVKDYDALADTRLSWLVKRITGIAPRSTQMQQFKFLYWHFYTTRTVCTFYTRPDDTFDEERYEEIWGKERELRDRLTKSVEEIIQNPPPRDPSKLERLQQKVIERRKAAKAEQEERKPLNQPERDENR